MIDVPELKVYDAPRSPEDTVADLGGSGARARVLDAVVQEREPDADIDLQIHGAAPPVASRGTKVRGLFGLDATGEFVLWILLAATGLTAIIFAAVLVEPYYIAGAAVWGPISFWKLRRAQRRWQGNRSFSRAVEDTIGV